MEKYYTKKSSAETIENRVEQKRPRIELDMRDIDADLGDRNPIDDFHHDIRDEARRAYLQIGPYRPASHKFPKTKKMVKANQEDLLDHGLINLIG